MLTRSYKLIFGNTGKPAEMRYTPQGTAVCTFSLATDASSKKGDKQTVWSDCEAWGAMAETLSGLLTEKGLPVFVFGREVKETWNDKSTGEVRSKTKYKVIEYIVLTKKADGSTEAVSGGEDEEEIIPVADE